MTLRQFSDSLENYLHERAIRSEALYGEIERDPRTDLQKLVDEYYADELPAVATPEEREVYFRRQDEMLAAHPELLEEIHDAQVLKFKDSAVQDFAERRWQARQALKDFYEIPPYKNLPLEQGKEIQPIMARVRDMVQYGQAPSQSAALKMLAWSNEYSLELLIMASKVESNPERKLFRHAHAEELGMFADFPVGVLEGAGVP